MLRDHPPGPHPSGNLDMHMKVLVSTQAGEVTHSPFLQHYTLQSPGFLCKILQCRVGAAEQVRTVPGMVLSNYPSSLLSFRGIRDSPLHQFLHTADVFNQ